ncbi:Aspartic proteinase-like protein 2 [Morella rubra]|uniref:Aspartic proteinase-like protein 2 n=1 Tax=Morella rubra TaxID=262757 RepID=A0A6A1VWA5_9ROSI|nr:Aspartic proteinase-like protein 2 [Morella rubra]
MARILFELSFTFSFFTIFSLTKSSPSTSPLLLLPPHGGTRSAMLLPLILSPLPNASRTSSNPRRHLQRSNARMGLYDDLLLHGYYTTRLWIGTPPQIFALIVDTGSTVTYVPCSTCEQCGRHQDPRFQPELSSTYRTVKCNLDCTCDNENVQCVYERQYAEMSTSKGVLGEDLISFGTLSELAPQRAVFGCENEETGDLYSQHADGIMGLGSGQLSIVDQLFEKGVIDDSFSLCYGGMDVGGGAMVLGHISPPTDMVFTHSDAARSPYYNIDLKNILVAGKPLPLNPRVFDGRYGTVLDSGTTYAYLPEAAFVAFKDAIMEELHSLQKIRGPDPNYNDICFSGAGSDVLELSKTFPVVDMEFSNGQKLSLSPENYLFRVHGAYCLGVFQNGKDPTTLLGGIFVRNTLVMYDRENSKIGFWKTNCSELWERLHISSAPPLIPSAPNGENSPSLAPTEAPPYVLPGERLIGQITFDILLNISYSDLEPHITELAKLIADGLSIKTSQIHLLNFTSKGNDSLVRWAILPAGPRHYISNSTATNMIARFAEHQVQLPGNFGSYQLVGWNIEPLAKRTWWQQNSGVVLLVIVSLVIGFSASAIWVIWRDRQQKLNAYKPVHAAVPEQELQPI